MLSDIHGIFIGGGMGDLMWRLIFTHSLLSRRLTMVMGSDNDFYSVMIVIRPQVGKGFCPDAMACERVLRFSLGRPNATHYP